MGGGEKKMNLECRPCSPPCSEVCRCRSLAPPFSLLVPASRFRSGGVALAHNTEPNDEYWPNLYALEAEDEIWTQKSQGVFMKG